LLKITLNLKMILLAQKMKHWDGEVNINPFKDQAQDS
jgi:hypothetical protein